MTKSSRNDDLFHLISEDLMLFFPMFSNHFNKILFENYPNTGSGRSAV